jgi:hypothetical protein
MSVLPLVLAMAPVNNKSSRTISALEHTAHHSANFAEDRITRERRPPGGGHGTDDPAGLGRGVSGPRAAAQAGLLGRLAV